MEKVCTKACRGMGFEIIGSEASFSPHPQESFASIPGASIVSETRVPGAVPGRATVPPVHKLWRQKERKVIFMSCFLSLVLVQLLKLDKIESCFGQVSVPNILVLLRFYDSFI